MKLNTKGFWRVLIVVYAVGALMGAAVAVNQLSSGWDCAETLALWSAHSEQWRAQQQAMLQGAAIPAAEALSVEPYPYCRQPIQTLGLLALFLVAAFVLLFGGGLALRWIWRGFAAPA